MSTSSIVDIIQHYQRNIERSQSKNDETRILHCINKLYKLPVEVKHLQETGIGKTINSLRKYNGETGTAAKSLVSKWKAMVAAEESNGLEDANGFSAPKQEVVNSDYKSHRERKHHEASAKLNTSKKHKHSSHHSRDHVKKSQEEKAGTSKSSSSVSVNTSSHKRPRSIPDENVTHESSKNKISKLRTNTEKGNTPEDDGIDSSMGANFADVLGMLNKPTKKGKKTKLNMLNTTTTSGLNLKSNSDYMKAEGSKASTSSATVGSSNGSCTKPESLESPANLQPLDLCIGIDLPSISNNYKPMPLNQTVMDCVFNTTTSSASKQQRSLTDAEALSHGISSKTMRTKIYSGIKSGQTHQVPSLFDLCIRVLQKNIDALEYTGGVPFEILRHVLDRATPQQLLIFEEYNPYVMEDTDGLWQQHVQRNYRTQKREEMETWREMFLRCQDDRERKLNVLAESIKQSQKLIKAPVRKTQLAFVDSLVKPPRNVQRKQELYGTKSKLIATPAARVAALSSVTPNATKAGDTRLRVAGSLRDPAQVAAIPARSKKAPLMVKTLQLMRGRNKRC